MLTRSRCLNNRARQNHNPLFSSDRLEIVFRSVNVVYVIYIYKYLLRFSLNSPLILFLKATPIYTSGRCLVSGLGGWFD